MNNTDGLDLSKLDSMDLYSTKKDSEEGVKNKETSTGWENPEQFIFERNTVCPVCGVVNKIKAVKKEGSRLTRMDSDFMPIYSGINRLFYEVSVCQDCGFAAMSKHFNNINEKQKMSIIQNISVHWKRRDFPSIYTVETAIEHHKLALLSATVKDAKASEKASICLRLSWLYRISQDLNLEKIYQKKALEGFVLAYETEDFPISGLDQWNLVYLIGELYRRQGNLEKSIRYISEIIVSQTVDRRLKEKARDIMEEIKKEKKIVE